MLKQLDATSLIRMLVKAEWANEKSRKTDYKRLKLEGGGGM